MSPSVSDSWHFARRGMDRSADPAMFYQQRDAFRPVDLDAVGGAVVPDPGDRGRAQLLQRFADWRSRPGSGHSTVGRPLSRPSSLAQACRLSAPVAGTSVGLDAAARRDPSSDCILGSHGATFVLPPFDAVSHTPSILAHVVPPTKEAHVPIPRANCAYPSSDCTGSWLSAASATRPRRRSIAGWPRTRSGRGSAARGSSRATPTSRRRPRGTRPISTRDTGAASCSSPATC